MEEFTFHNVSINSLSNDVEAYEKVLFTFHNVSINSENVKNLLSINGGIYIP